MNRECGSCTLCCKLLPVKGINKPALKRCQFQRHTGCTVYHKPEKGFPWECGLWNCIWLQGDDAANLSRPDRSHYVIDVMPDYVTAQEPDLGVIKIPVVQIWVDPKHPEAHRDPELRAWLLRRQGFAGLIRYGNEEAFVLFPPYMMNTHEWVEKRSGNLQKEKTHSFREVLTALNEL